MSENVITIKIAGISRFAIRRMELSSTCAPVFGSDSALFATLSHIIDWLSSHAPDKTAYKFNLTSLRPSQ